MPRLKRRARAESGQVLVATALLLALVFVLLLGFLGAAGAIQAVAGTQTAADAAALGGAEQVVTENVTLNGQIVCSLTAVDPARAAQAAWRFWQANTAGQPVQTAAFTATTVSNTVTVTASVRMPNALLGITGHSPLTWQVTAQAHALRSWCRNPFSGPVFALDAWHPAGWPDPAAQRVWNAPTALLTAPAGWPVYFVRVFSLPAATTVTVYAAADNAFDAQIDGRPVVAGTLAQGVRSGQVDLGPGPHALVVRAENTLIWPPIGPNPAWLLLAAYDGHGNLLFDTQGNPYASGGRPNGPDRWSSYSPPNPDWAVYADPFYPTSWVSNGGALAQALRDAGYTAYGAQDLARWMQQEIQSGRAAKSLLVMAQDVIPDTVAQGDTAGALIRQYLDAGGNVLWLGDAPFYYQGHANRPVTATVWGTAGMRGILGVADDKRHWTWPGQTPAATPAGRAYGLLYTGGVAQLFPSARAIPDWGANGWNCQVQPLADFPGGGASYWRAPFWPNRPASCDAPWGQVFGNDSPGFVRVYDAPVDGADGYTQTDALGIAGTILGWYRDQATYAEWRNPYAGPVFGEGAAGDPPWRRADWPDANAQWIWDFPLANMTAPAGWPVSFARLFTLQGPATVTLYAAADNRIVRWSVDGQSLPVDAQGCGWQDTCAATVSLGAGSHLLEVTAVNMPGGQRFANPAGLLVSAYANGSLIFDSRPDGNWTSRADPNPDWAVYYDPSYPTSWLQGGAQLAAYFAQVGFQTLDAQGLARWMQSEIASGRAPQSLVVMAQDVVPDTVAQSASAGALVRRYLDAGGNVLWTGDVPFYYQGHAGGGSTVWGTGGLQAVLGMGDTGQYWNDGRTPAPTAAGNGYGVGDAAPDGTAWQAGASWRAIPQNGGYNCQVERLADAPDGGAAYWRAPFWPNAVPACSFGQGYIGQVWASDAPGFVRVYDAGANLADAGTQKSLLMAAGQILGWYPGQDTALRIAVTGVSLNPNPAQGGQRVTATVTTSGNARGVTLALPWNGQQVNLTWNGSAWTGSFAAPQSPGNYTVTATATGAAGQAAQGSATLMVYGLVAQWPLDVPALQVTGVSFSPNPAQGGQQVTATVRVSGPAAQSVTLTLPWNGQTVGLTWDGQAWTGAFAAPGAAGTYTLTATAVSADGQTAQGTGQLTVVGVAARWPLDAPFVAAARWPLDAP